MLTRMERYYGETISETYKSTTWNHSVPEVPANVPRLFVTVIVTTTTITLLPPGIECHQLPSNDLDDCNHELNIGVVRLALTVAFSYDIYSSWDYEQIVNIGGT